MTIYDISYVGGAQKHLGIALYIYVYRIKFGDGGNKVASINIYKGESRFTEPS